MFGFMVAGLHAPRHDRMSFTERMEADAECKQAYQQALPEPVKDASIILATCTQKGQGLK